MPARLAIWLADLGVLAVPTSTYTGIAKYPLLAMPMFVLVGSIFDRSGVALRARQLRRRRWSAAAPGTLAAVTVLVAMFLGGISGSGPANAAAVGGVMIAAHVARRLSDGVLGQRDRRGGGDRHPDPAVDRAHHLQRAGAAGLGAGAVRGRHDPRHPGRHRADRADRLAVAASTASALAEKDLPRPPFWRRFSEAIWGLLAPVLILGGMRAGWFTPTEAAVVAVVYGLFVGFVIYRSLTLRDLYEMLVEAAEISGVILIVVALASIFALGRRDARRRSTRSPRGDRRPRLAASTSCWRC